MKKFKPGEQQWFPMAVAICTGVLFYYLLNHLQTLWSILKNIGYFIYPLFAGAVLAYIMNPLMNVFDKRLFRKLKNPKARRGLALVLSLLIICACIGLILGMLVPQIYNSVMMLYNNADTYIAALSEWVGSLGGEHLKDYFENLRNTSISMLDLLSDLISENSSSIGKSITNIGGQVAAWGIGVIFSVYFLAGKDKIKEGGAAMIRMMQKDPEKSEAILVHLRKINTILTQYLTFSIIDGLIVGVVNAIFMLCTGMEYVGLISVVVGVTNLIPTFGPIIGAVIGSFILLLVKPVSVVYFLIFTLILQTIDGYVLKPKLFGNTFGVSGLWILVAIIVGGRIFGIPGILLSIPFVAIMSYLIHSVYLPHREKQVSQTKTEEEDTADTAEDPED